MSEFITQYCDDDNILDNYGYINTICDKRDSTMCCAIQQKQIQPVQIPKLKKHRTLADMQKFDILIRDFEIMLSRQKKTLSSE
jgi:hypothetical protein